MPAPPRPRRPTWAQLGGGAFAVFAVVLAFLAGRVRAGTDPALARSATPAQPSVAQAPAQQQAVPDDPSQQQLAPDPDPPVTHAS